MKKRLKCKFIRLNEHWYLRKINIAPLIGEL